VLVGACELIERADPPRIFTILGQVLGMLAEALAHFRETGEIHLLKTKKTPRRYFGVVGNAQDRFAPAA
jgi:hypothetical protein